MTTAQILWLASICSIGAHAFRDASPFFGFSSSQYFDRTSLDLNFASANFLQPRIAPQHSACHDESYIIVSQPGVSARDFSGKDSAPHLRRRMLDSTSSASIPDVVGEIDTSSIVGDLEKACGVQASVIETRGSHVEVTSEQSQILRVNFPSLPVSQDRRSKLLQHDSTLNVILTNLQPYKYTVFFTTTPRNQTFLPSQQTSQKPLSKDEPLFDFDSEDEPYNALEGSLHTNMQRDLSSSESKPLLPRQSGRSNATNAPLFERYNFLSDGIYMGVFVAILLGSILYVGISGVASLEVSYHAFSKETGPSSQKKQG